MLSLLSSVEWITSPTHFALAVLVFLGLGKLLGEYLYFRDLESGREQARQEADPRTVHHI